MDISALRDEFASLHTEANKVLENKAKEQREYSSEEKEAQDKRYARLDQIKATVEEHKKLAETAFNAGEIHESNSRAKFEFEKANPFAPKLTEKDVINEFMRTGVMPAHQFIQITTSGSSILLPKKLLPATSIRANQNAFRKLYELLGKEPIDTTDTAQYVLPVYDVSGQAAIQQAEDASGVNTETDATISGSLTLNPVLYSSTPKFYSNTMLLSSSFDVLGYTLPILQKLVDKKQESVWTTTAKGLSAGYTTASNAAITYTDILNWEHSLAVAYRYDAGFIVSDGVYRALRGLVDSNNRPIMDLDPTNVFQQELHGKPVVVSDYFSAIGASNKLGLFGSVEGIVIRDVSPQRLTRYINNPAYPDQTGVELFANGDCQLVPAAVSLLVQHS